MSSSATVESVIPGAQGRVFAALLRVDGARTVSELSRLAGISRDRAGTVVAGLEQLGLIERRPVGRAWSVSIIEEHPVVEALRAIEQSHERSVRKLREAARSLDPAPTWMALYGSWARGTSTAGSDLDVAVIAMPSDDRRYDSLLAELDRWASFAQRVTSLTVSLLIVEGADEATGSLWDSIRRDAIVLVGDESTEVADDA